VVESGKSAEVVMSKGSSRMAKRVFSLLLVLFVILVLIPSVCFSLILENLEIIFQKTYVDAAAPDSLWSWGKSIDCAGDVNNDGYDDIIVAATTVDGASWLGKAYIFLGGDPMDTIPDIILTGTDNMFLRVAGVGDFNHDGFDDVLVAHEAGDQAVKMFFGGTPMDTIPDLVLETRSGQSGATGISAAGDVNGDSIDDCIVGDYWHNSLDGRALIFFGDILPDSLPDVVLNGHDSEGMGISVGGGGDLNGDGFDDVVVGADANSEAALGAGKVYGFFGGSPMDTIPDVWLFGEGPSHFLGWYGVDIVKHDTSYDWLVVGSIFYPNGFPADSPGKIYVMYGDSSMDTLVDAYMVGRTDSSDLGEATSCAGDVDASGMGDIVSGATQEYQRRGTAYLWLGSIPLDTVPDASAEGELEGQEVGWITRTAGDVDNDGYDEIMFSNYAAAGPPHMVWIARYRKTGVAEVQRDGSGPIRAQILHNYPNPFASETFILFQFGTSQGIALQIYDVGGRLVRTFSVPKAPEARSDKAIRRVRWDATDQRGLLVPSGVYFAKLRMPEQDARVSQTCKLILVR